MWRQLNSLSAWACALPCLGLGVYLIGLIFGQLDQDRIHRSPTWTRMANSAALVLAALLWWRLSKNHHLSPYAALIFWGMLCSFVGDLLMARVIPLPMHPVPGMIVFGTAHIIYIVAYARAGQALALADGRIWAGGIGGGLILAGLLWRVLIHTPGGDPILGYGSLGYAMLLGAMAGGAVALALQQPRFTLLALGAFLFLASDAILGNRLFRDNDWLLVGDVVWILYIAGQSLIVFTLAVVWPSWGGL
ncbi:MAG: lysoplasmalogenase family protein [Anaerolineae bacterium]|jgi:uncharacterized membrane protein YhhN